MARKSATKGSKRDRQKGVNKKKRDGKKPVSYKMKKIGPKVKNFDGETIGHLVYLPTVMGQSVVLMNQKKPKEDKKDKAEKAA